jgi:hypothetical protein
MIIKMIFLITVRKESLEGQGEKVNVEVIQMMSQLVMIKSWIERRENIEAVYFIMMKLLIDLKDK